MELSCQVQNYDWGKKGSQSIVAQLQKSADPVFQIDEDLPYAELWMGTHVNGTSIVKKTKEKLSDIIKRHPNYLGEGVLEQFKQELPFLFKVLSVNKALSIQAHPSKSHAEELHSKFPDIYKDPNHKPEMAIALTRFEALCGFRPLAEIKSFFALVPELSDIVGCEALLEDCTLIKKAFRAVLTCDKGKITNIINNILERFGEHDEFQRDTVYAELVERLHSQFPYDNGVLMVYFLNYMQLMPGDAIFLGANEPHAYLSGDCIECMACSDNVVRAGLTPKFVDVNTLCSMLLYQGSPKEDKLFTPIREDDCTMIFRPPVPDFAVILIKVSTSKFTHYTPKERSSASILLFVNGEATYVNGIVVPGTVLFIPANTVVQFSNLKSDLLIYQAIANV
ncbi:mannose-6-phosphate isomerase [Anthonomus grandis grandis]|uniref:mannose-6-phosphate isomerase n=1 Tax=Anthonomus grandis grandis TaxID=2921223 RepID=UPI002165E492|nr:mannose-6-phosphate isomerase [Anthonomus grandis grandis]